MPILHFSGKFRNQPPLYNNEPWNSEKYFDENIPPEVVHKNITDGVEPLQYFEFEFLDVFVKMVTYDDGTRNTNKDKDAIIDKKIMLKALMVDTAPHLERSRLFAGELRIIDLIIGKMQEGFESDLFTTIRSDKVGGVEKFSADFESNLYDLYNLGGDFITKENSRYFREASLDGSKNSNKSNNNDYNSNNNNNDNNINKLKIYFHLCKFDYSSLEGEVYGYIGPQVPELENEGIRIHGRRLLVDPSISDELRRDFLLEPPKEESQDVARDDLEGTYEIIKDNRLIILRYLNFITYSDTKNNTPPGYHYFIKVLEGGREIRSDIFKPVEIMVDHKNISDSGGTFIFQIPPEKTKDVGSLSLAIVITKNNGKPQPFMREPKYDLLFKEDQKYLILESGKSEELKISVYENNRLCIDKSIDVILENFDNDRSPTVAKWTATSSRSAQGIITCGIQALDLENSSEIDDPIAGIDPDTKKANTSMAGDLPWDRYYGNYVSIKIADHTSSDSNDEPSTNKKETKIKFNIPVRVLHSVRLDNLKDSIEQLDKEKIQEVMIKILSYYTRYYPWLHVQYEYKGRPPNPSKIGYSQFLKIREHLTYLDNDSLDNWGAVQETVTGINHFLERLERKDNDWKKMPRSRDFPFNGIEFLKMWKASIIDKVIEQINVQKDNIISRTDQDSELADIDMDNWKNVQDILSSIDNLVDHLSSDKDKQLVSLWKIQIFETILDDLNQAKNQSKHSHKHN